MQAGTYDILVERGVSFELALRILNEAKDAYIDLTDHTFSGIIKKNYSDSAVLATMVFTVTPFADLTDPTDTSQISLYARITDENTALIEIPTATTHSQKTIYYTYDIISQDNSGNKYRWIQGDAKISPGVTP